MLEGPSFNAGELGHIADEALRRGAFAERENRPVPELGEYYPVHLWQAFSRCGYLVDDRVALDSAYRLPTREWFLGGFATALQSSMFKLGIEHTGKQSSDCDKLSRFAFWYGPWLHAKYGDKSDAGFAIGITNYVPDGNDYVFQHSIVTAICRDGDFLEPVHYDPQLRRRVSFTENEKRCVSLVIF
jgi:hypothetical protein